MSFSVSKEHSNQILCDLILTKVSGYKHFRVRLQAFPPVFPSRLPGHPQTGVRQCPGFRIPDASGAGQMGVGYSGAPYGNMPSR